MEWVHKTVFNLYNFLPILFINTSFDLFQIKLNVPGEEIVIPLGSVEEEIHHPLVEKTQVLVAKDSDLISDDAYHASRMSLPEDVRAMIPPLNVIKDERKRQNQIVEIHPISEVSGSFFFDNERTLMKRISWNF